MLRSFVKTISKSLNKGMIFFIDYGYGEAEYYHPERRTGTLTCFYQHHHHQNPFIYPGLQDITAHVNFTEVIDAAHDEGCALSGFTTQSAFLLASGLLDHAETIVTQASPAEAFNIHQSIKTLTLPTQMGDRVKVMALSKNMDLSLKGFQLADRRRDL
jgi:SAM-dependent MidA family methyltransferase